MKCENRLCIYWSKGSCLLDKIQIDSLGMCAECIYPHINEEILNEAKSIFLKIYESEDKNLNLQFWHHYNTDKKNTQDLFENEQIYSIQQ